MHAPQLVTLWGQRVCQSFGMGTRMNDKLVNYSHILTQTKQQIVQCIVGTFLMHERAMSKYRPTRLTTTQTWGKPPPSPLQYFLCLATGPTPKCHFVPRLSRWSLAIPKIGTFATLEAHNFVCKPPIEMKSKTKVQPLSRSFQSYVARHLHARKLGRFLTFSGWESNC